MKKIIARKYEVVKSTNEVVRSVQTEDGEWHELDRESREPSLNFTRGLLFGFLLGLAFSLPNILATFLPRYTP